MCITQTIQIGLQEEMISSISTEPVFHLPQEILLICLSIAEDTEMRTTSCLISELDAMKESLSLPSFVKEATEATDHTSDPQE